MISDPKSVYIDANISLPLHASSGLLSVYFNANAFLHLSYCWYIVLSCPSTLMLILLALSLQVKENFQTVAAEVSKSIMEDNDFKETLDALQKSVMFSVYY